MSTPVIQLRELDRTYKTGEVEVKAVRGVTLDIHRGEFVAIMGSSGSGKSTLMNTIGCLDQPTSGTYLLDGVAVADLHGFTAALGGPAEIFADHVHFVESVRERQAEFLAEFLVRSAGFSRSTPSS